MRRLTFSELRHHPTRFAGVLIAIIISVGFVSGCLVFLDTQSAAIQAGVSARTAAANVVVQPTDETSLTAQIAATPGVAVVEPSSSAYVSYTADGTSGRVQLTSLPTDQRLQPAELADGRWPVSPSEIALSASSARASKLSIGSVLAINDGTVRTTAQVVGLTNEPTSLFEDLVASGWVPRSSPVMANAWTQYLVIASAGTTPDELATSLRQRLPKGTQVQTSAEIAADALAGITDGIDVIRIALLSFGGIALLVAAIIISTTFAVVVAQRRRQLGLLRTLGAGRGQVWRSVLVESAVIGIVGAILGLLLGVALAAVGSLTVGVNVFAAEPVGLVIKAVPLALAGAVGFVVTVLAALAPARRATRVSPLDALRPVADTATERTYGRVRLVIAALLVLGGAAVVVLAFVLREQTVLIAMAGSALLALGILLGAAFYLPPMLRLAARLLGRAHPVARLAAANLVRNPARAATVATALMLGVGLIVTLQVGAASVKASTEASLRSEFPVDITLSGFGTPVPAGAVEQVRAVPGVGAAIAVPGVEIDIGADRGALTAYGLGNGADQVVAAGFDQLRDGVALVHPNTLGQIGASDGEAYTLRDGGRELRVVLHTSDVAESSGSIVLTAADLSRLAPNASTLAVWAAASPGADVVSVMNAMQQIADGSIQLMVGGSLEQVAQIQIVLDALLTGATALTAVAVVIALVGVGTTLGLSVLERQRESALLRALGLQRRQLRLMLAVEAVLLAVLGSLVGVVSGLLFGWVGSAAMAAESEFAETRFAVSAPQLLVVVGVALVAAALASVLPGRRAAQASPVAALGGG